MTNNDSSDRELEELARSIKELLAEAEAELKEPEGPVDFRWLEGKCCICRMPLDDDKAVPFDLIDDTEFYACPACMAEAESRRSEQPRDPPGFSLTRDDLN